MVGPGGERRPSRGIGFEEAGADQPEAHRRRLRPVHRTMLTIGTGLLCGTLLLGTGIVLARGPKTDIQALRTHVNVVQNSLNEVHASLAKSSDEIRQSLAESDPLARTALISAAATTNLRESAALKIYQDAKLGLPGEAALFKRFQAAQHRQTAETIDRFSAQSTDPATIITTEAQLARDNQELLGSVEKIRDLYTERDDELLRRAQDGFNAIAVKMLVAFGLLSLIWVPIIYVTMRGANEEEHDLRTALRLRQESNRVADLDNQVARALEMATTEGLAYEVVTHGMQASLEAPELGEFLVAASDRAHFRQVSGTGPDGEGPGCPVGGPDDCPATKTGQTLVFPSSDRLGACPQLRDRSIGPCSAVCVPVAIAGRSIGVLHVTAAPGVPPGETAVQDLELLARKTGDRVGMLRAFAKSEEEASTDPLTGLLNRRNLELRVRRLVEQGDPYVIAFADLDHFKDLNDAFGHATGDRALRVFSRALRDSIRPDDNAARWGGEEFLTVLPDCTLADAQVVAERLRDRLAHVLAKGDVPAFTVSIGLAGSDGALTFDEVVHRADEALMEAKASGRNLVVLAEPKRAPASSVVSLPGLQPEGTTGF